MAPSQSNPIKVFICYAHKDKPWLDRLKEHLEPFVLQNLVHTWSDQDIEIGDDWHGKIQESLQSAKVAILLVSASFLASKYIRNSELPVLLKNAKEKGVIILPVIVRPCLFTETKFKYPHPVNGPEEFSLASLQASNSPGEALSGLDEHRQEEILVSVAKRVLSIVESKVDDQDGIKSKVDDPDEKIIKSYCDHIITSYERGD